MKTPLLTLTTCLLLASLSKTHAELPVDLQKNLDRQNVVWNSPSEDAKGSMPIGNGDIGANVWVEPNGDLVFFISKTDSWDENNSLIKIGKVRVQFTPPLVVEGQAFSQKLDLANGRILFESDDQTVMFWIDANHPVIQIDAIGKGGKKLSASAQVELWRTAKRETMSGELWAEKRGIVYPDTVLPKGDHRIGWYHHNVNSHMDANLELQNITEAKEVISDPIKGRTFGAIVGGEGWNSTGDLSVETAAATNRIQLQIVSLTQICDQPEEWVSDAVALSRRVGQLDSTRRFDEHRAWWHDFWKRSWIFASEDRVQDAVDDYAAQWIIGRDSSGHSQFRGELADLKVISRALDAEAIEELAGEAPTGAGGDASLFAEDSHGNSTVMAWIKPSGGAENGRILESRVPGDVLIFDTWPGNALRLIIGRNHSTLILKDCLTPGKWQHVAVSIDRSDQTARFYIDGNRVFQGAFKAEGKSGAEIVTQGYTLNRFMLACAGRGDFPIKFNGSLFTVDNTDFGPDYRRWGGHYWHQNTRLLYWPMLMTGDFEMMQPFFDLYLNTAPVRRIASQNYFGHDGIYYPETMDLWGAYHPENYGYDRTGKPDGYTDNSYIRYHWTGTLEILNKMIDYYEFTQDEQFRTETLIPFAEGVFLFFDKHWERKNGKIHFEPAQALETFHHVVNPAPEIAALKHDLPRMIKLTDDAALKQRWQSMLADVPELPIETREGKDYLAPAEKYDKSAAVNMENPELYSLFPARLFDLTSSEEALQMVYNTWDARRENTKGAGCWYQNDIFAAVMGNTEEAQRHVVARASSSAGDFRFPAMWGPNHDWTPDMDHGGVLMIALQYMLMQYDDEKIILNCAWPKEWNAEFKLHAQKETTVQGKIRNGKVVELKVTPHSRLKDVIIRQRDEFVPAHLHDIIK